MTTKQCACGLNSDQHSLAQSAKCDGKRRYGSEYKPRERKRTLRPVK